MSAQPQVNPVAVLQSESSRLAEAGEHKRSDRLIQAANAVAELVEAAESALRREEFKQGPDAGNDALVRNLRAALANFGGDVA